MATQVLNVFLSHLFVSYCVSSNLVADSGPLFVSWLFATLCGLLGLEPLATAQYHPKTNAQVQKYNKRTVARLEDYVAEHQNS